MDNTAFKATVLGEVRMHMERAYISRECCECIYHGLRDYLSEGKLVAYREFSYGMYFNVSVHQLSLMQR